MPKVAGATFTEILGEDKGHYLQEHQHDHVMHQIGAVLALDGLLQNPDRFLCLGSDGNNNGNLMLDRQGNVHVIDSTMPPPRITPERSRQNHQAKLRQALTFVKDPTNQTALNHIKSVVHFFRPDWKIEWQDIQGAVVRGFVAQAKHISDAVKEAKKHGTVDPAQADALLRQHALFVELAS